jgi:hypothetical protein
VDRRLLRPGTRHRRRPPTSSRRRRLTRRRPCKPSRGCSFNAGQLRGEIGTSHLVNCPPGCSNSGNGLWGSDAYTADSGVCRAAIHAGLISDAGGNVVVTLDPGRPAYRGSVRNGVRSGDYGNYGKSFHLSRP